MIEQLRIAGLALLEDCELSLGPGLTAITGETGAGKTMVLTALRLLSGGRADPKAIKVGRDRLEIDAYVTLDAPVAAELEEGGYAVEDGGATFSRTVQPNRSKGAISGRPVPAKALQDSIGKLISIHGQSDQWRLKSPSHQRELLDTKAGGAHQELLEAYRECWDRAQAARRRFEEVTGNQDRLAIELRYLAELSAQIDQLDPQVGEEEEIEAAIERLSNVEDLRVNVASALAALAGEDEPAAPPSAATLLSQLADSVRRAADLDSALMDLSERADSIQVEAEELALDLRSYLGGLFDDPEELARLHQRRADLTELCRGRAVDAGELIEWNKRAQQRISELESGGNSPEVAAGQLAEAEEALTRAARALHDSRVAAGRALERAVNAELGELALADAQFIVEVESTQVGPSGADRVQMLLRAHPTAPARPLGEGASGGELSRIMLAVEVALADEDEALTMVFDEVDAGIGGLTAVQVGKRLRRLSRAHQVLIVTHLPQVAALADANFVVEKKDGIAAVHRVQGPDRTDELVRMLGGDDGTGAARRHALELESQGGVAQSGT